MKEPEVEPSDLDLLNPYPGGSICEQNLADGALRADLLQGGPGGGHGELGAFTGMYLTPAN